MLLTKSTGTMSAFPLISALSTLNNPLPVFNGRERVKIMRGCGHLPPQINHLDHGNNLSNPDRIKINK